MRKKSHILVARYLADQFPQLQGMQEHRKALCLGSILPDLRPSFITKRHEFESTFEETKGKIIDILKYLSTGKHLTERVFWRRIGEILHYIADYFTFPHNSNYTGTLIEHNSYEKILKDEMKDFILSDKVQELPYEKHEFSNVDELAGFIQKEHDDYLQKKGKITSDIMYILSMSYYTMLGIFQLLEKNDLSNFLGNIDGKYCFV